MSKLLPCPFCGGMTKVVQCDDEGNVRGEEYESNPWSGLGYRIVHESDDCPIYTCEDGYNLIYDSREEAENHWNSRANECDRDELLNVANEMYEDTTSFEIKDVPENIPAWVVFKWHERIRKALGVE